MSQAHVSKHSSTLIDLGFDRHKVGPDSMFYTWLAEHDNDNSPVVFPCFGTIHGAIQLTYAFDEYKQLWLCIGVEADLTMYGFTPIPQTHLPQ